VDAGLGGAVGAALISGGPLVAVGQVHGVLHAVLAGLDLPSRSAESGRRSGSPARCWSAPDDSGGSEEARRPEPPSPRGSVLRVRVPAIFQPTGQRELATLKELIDAERRSSSASRQHRSTACSPARGAASERGQLAGRQPGRRSAAPRHVPGPDPQGGGERGTGGPVRPVPAGPGACLANQGGPGAIAQSGRWAGAALGDRRSGLVLQSTGSNGPAYVPVVTTTPTPSTLPAIHP